MGIKVYLCGKEKRKNNMPKEWKKNPTPGDLKSIINQIEDPITKLILIIGVILPAILYFIVENFIFRYIFLVFSLVFFSGLVFYDVIRIIEKKNLMIYLFLALLCGLFMPLIFTLIHELYHAITAIINGFRVLGIEVSYPMGGATHLAEDTNFIGRENIAILVYLSGSLGSVLSAGIINRIIYRLKTEFSVFLPLFIITSFRIIGELSGWIIGIDNYIKGIDSGNDAYKVLYYLQLDDPLILLVPLIMQGILIFSLIALLVWFAFNLIKRIREERNAIKKNIQNYLK